MAEILGTTTGVLLVIVLFGVYIWITRIGDPDYTVRNQPPDPRRDWDEQPPKSPAWQPPVNDPYWDAYVASAHDDEF